MAADAPTSHVTALPPIGREMARVDGPLKVSGAARYSSDFDLPGLLFAVPVGATVASGRIASIDTAKAGAMPGVKKIYTHQNIGRFSRVPKSAEVMIDERRPPLDDEVIGYYGQYVALVVADSFEGATVAARAVEVNYTGARKPDVSKPITGDDKPKTETERGDPDRAFAGAEVKLDRTYTTPAETHNPIELHASVAHWDGDAFTLYETTQAIMNYRATLAQMLGVPMEKVRVITEFLGSGFGGKLWAWPHALLAAQASRDLGTPVKLVVTRATMFHAVGHRPPTHQRMRLGATRAGKLMSLQQDFVHHRSLLDSYTEDCGEATGFLYSTKNLRITSGFARRNVGVPTSMRGPGAVPGLFAVESAMDELAIALDMDPIELRLANEPAIDEKENLPFSSRHLKECLTTGAEKFGWSRRNPKVGSMRDREAILGWGVAACSWIADRFPAEVSVTLKANGTVRVASGTQDIGTGTYTMLAQMAAELTGVTVDQVQVVIGDTRLPPGPISGGSMATASLVPALAQATRDAIGHLLAAAGDDGPYKGVAADALKLSEGRVHRKDQSPSQGRPFQDVLTQARLDHVEGKGKAEGTFGKKDKKFSSHSFGAHFVEIAWQPEIARLRVRRTLSVIDAGRIINPLTGRNQIEGAVAMGIGMAMFEQTQYDPRNGMPVNANLADYVMTTHADAPAMEVVFLDYPDTHLNEFGARGIGEIGMAGIAAAITNAVHHATGIRIRDLPIGIEDLLASKVA